MKIEFVTREGHQDTAVSYFRPSLYLHFAQINKYLSVWVSALGLELECDLFWKDKDMAGVENVVSLLTVLYQHCENVKALTEACGRIRNIVGVFQTLLGDYLAAMRGKALPAWVGELEKALRDGIDAVKKIKANPMKAKMFPASYTGTLEAVRVRIRDAMEAISLTNATVGAQAKDAMASIGTDLSALEQELLAARDENAAFMAELKDLMKSNQTELLNAFARDHDFADAEALRRDLAASEEEHRTKLKTVKDAGAQQDLQIAIELSKVAMATMQASKCPNDFLCPITLELMEDPVILAQSEQTYERKAIQHALIERPGVDPKTNARFEGNPMFIANRQLKGAIEQWQQEHKVVGGGGGAALPSPPPSPLEYSRGGGGGGGGGGVPSSPPPPPLLRKSSGAGRFSVSFEVVSW